jgi:hypothetical protein
VKQNNKNFQKVYYTSLIIIFLIIIALVLTFFAGREDSTLIEREGVMEILKGGKPATEEEKMEVWNRLEEERRIPASSVDDRQRIFDGL